MAAKAEFFAFDTETTGLLPEVCEMVSVSMVLLDSTLTPVEELTLYAHPSPTAQCDAKALEINGYTREKWDKLGATSQEEMFKGVIHFLKGQSRLKQIAHNLPFDRAFFEKFFAKHSGNNSRLYSQIFGYHGLDTVGVAIFTDLVTLNATRASYSLVNLSEAYGVVHAEAHTSASDVHAMIDVLQKMRETLQGKIVVDANAVKEALEKPRSISRIITKVDSESNIWKFTAGKHSGRTVTDVMKFEPDYLEFCLRMENLSDEQRLYLEQTYKAKAV